MKKQRNKELPTENFPNNRPCSPYYILKVAAQTNAFVAKQHVGKN
jgi:hypothetical protein